MISHLDRWLTILLVCAPFSLGAAEVMRSFAHVGETQREYSDPERSNWRENGARTLRTLVWYPAVESAEQAGMQHSGEEVSVQVGAQITPEPDLLPTIMLSHGSGNHADQLRWLAVALASHGFLVVAVEHNGGHDDELGGLLSATDFFAWERPRDLAVVLDRLLVEETLGPRVDRQRIGAAGFSLGATTVLWLGGARLDLELLKTSSPPTPPFLQESIHALVEYSKTSEAGRASMTRAGRSYRDDRIKAIFALSPAMGPGFPESFLHSVDVPVLIAVGDADVIAPAKDNAVRFAHAIPGARLEVLSGERGHYTRPIEPAQRDKELGEVAGLAQKFFADTLR